MSGDLDAIKHECELWIELLEGGEADAKGLFVAARDILKKLNNAPAEAGGL